MLFNIHINDLDAGLEGILSKFADCTKPRGAVKSLKGREGLQRDLDKSEKCEITNCVKFTKGKCWILHLGRGNPGCLEGLWNERLESSCRKELGSPGPWQVERESAVPWQPVGTSMSWRHYVKYPWSGRGLSCSALQPHLKCWGQFGAPQYKKDIKPLDSIQRRVTRMVKSLEGMPYEEQLRALGLFSWRRLRAELSAVLQLPHEGKRRGRP